MIVLVSVASVAFGWFGLWWMAAAPSLALGFFCRRARQALRRGSLAGGLAWLAAAVAQDVPTGGRLSARIGGILQVPAGANLASNALAHAAAYVVTAAIAALLSALAAWVGFCVRDLLWPAPGTVKSAPSR